jgi:hypothetical protein
VPAHCGRWQGYDSFQCGLNGGNNGAVAGEGGRSIAALRDLNPVAPACLPCENFLFRPRRRSERRLQGIHVLRICTHMQAVAALPARNSIEEFRRRNLQDACEQHEFRDCHRALTGLDPDNRVPVHSHVNRELLLREVRVSPGRQDDCRYRSVAAL